MLCCRRQAEMEASARLDTSMRMVAELRAVLHSRAGPGPV